MTDDTFIHDDLDYVRRVFSLTYTHMLIHQSTSPILDEALDYLGDLEEKILHMIRERACH